MQKPVTIEIDEFRDKLFEVINNCTLHPFIVSTVVNEITREVNRQVDTLATRERQLWKDKIEKEKEVKEEVEEENGDTE